MRRLRSIVQWWRMIHSEDSLPYASVTSIDSGKTLHVDSQVQLEVNQITTTIPETLLGNQDCGRNTYTRRSSVIVRVCALVNTSRQTGLDTSTTRVGTITSRKVVPISPISPVELNFKSISLLQLPLPALLTGQSGSTPLTWTVRVLVLHAHVCGFDRVVAQELGCSTEHVEPSLALHRPIRSVRVALGDMRERMLGGSKPGFGRTRR